MVKQKVRRKNRVRPSSLLNLNQLRTEAIHLRMKIPKLRGEDKERAIETYSELFSKIRRLENIERPIYLLRYE